VTRSTRSGVGWAVVGLVVLQVLTGVGSVAAQDRLRAGTKDLGFAGGYSFTHRFHQDDENVDGWHLLPHFGFVLTDPVGPGWIRGNFELLAEPTLVHFRFDTRSGTAGGLTAVGRWIFATPWKVQPYLEVGMGLLGGQLSFRQTNCDINYVLEGGPGLWWFVSDAAAITLGYRFQHVSNADICSQNFGLNSGLFMLGFSYFFP
jgi:lipid A 3-O-deacylase